VDACDPLIEDFVNTVDLEDGEEALSIPAARTWGSMAVCGNRAKAQTFRRRSG
jgi:hypothetical protein